MKDSLPKAELPLGDSKVITDSIALRAHPNLRACILAGILFSTLNTIILFWYMDMFVQSTFSLVLYYSIIALWFCTLLGELVDMLGFIYWKPAPIEKQNLSVTDAHLSVRFVSRGKNLDALQRSTAHAAYLLSNSSPISFSIQIVTDEPVAQHFISPAAEKFEFIVVDDEFRCPLGSRFKARALEYARLHAPLQSAPEWILFLDEESLLTNSAVDSVLDFISKDKARNEIGQGVIIYTSGDFGVPLPIAIADCQRAGYELGRLRLQYQAFQTVLFCFHGSFFVCSKDVVDKVTFDSGPKASIVEDIYFAMFAACKGVGFRFLPGYIREQSPENYLDFMKQRARWKTGLTYFVFDGRIPLRKRLPLLINTLASRAYGVIFCLLAISALCSMQAHRFAMLFLAAYLSVLRASYLAGVSLTLSDTPIPQSAYRPLMRTFLFYAPVLAFLDACASLYALFRPERGFYVVKKSAPQNSGFVNAVSESI